MDLLRVKWHPLGERERERGKGEKDIMKGQEKREHAPAQDLVLCILRRMIKMEARWLMSANRRMGFILLEERKREKKKKEKKVGDEKAQPLSPGTSLESELEGLHIVINSAAGSTRFGLPRPASSFLRDPFG